ncbi:TerC family protein [Azospira restricta]|uniref:TerC family protein n=1 Tax=Azospira restricta TaxID=404405 RepID=UPI001EEFAB54|nr:TerC family protein [Azospira restricta]
MPESFVSPEFWVAVLQIIMIDLVLSGDNAVVIALACRNLPAEQRRQGILWGVAGAVGLRVVLTMAAAVVMNLPWLKLVGGVLLLWIGVKLLLPGDDDGHEVSAADHLWGAVRTIVIADFVMSVDNVIAVAGASHGNLGLLLFGLVVSIPLIVWSSQIVLRLMERWPVVVVIGGALLGWVAGSMIWSDPAVGGLVAAFPAGSASFAAALSALLVVALGKWMETRRLRTAAIAPE